MYLRESKQKRADGSVVTYLQLAENVWNAEKRRAETRILYNCGRADDEAVNERLRRLAKSILRRCSPEEIVASDGNWRLVCAWPYGELYALEALWQRLGIGEVITEQAGARRLGFEVERALFAMVANRTCAPCSKLYCYEQWLREEVKIVGTEGLSLQHLYRAMDFLEANKEAIERAILFRVADLLNLDVEVIFYDTTSLHFEVDEEDRGVGPEELVHGSRAAGRKSYRAPRKRGHPKNGRSDVPRESWWVWPSRARASRCATGYSRATRSMSPPSSRSRPISGAGSSRAVCSWAMRGWSQPPISKCSHALGANICYACRCAAAMRLPRKCSPGPGATKRSPRISRSRKSSSAKVSGDAATCCATTRRRPNASDPTARN